ncbi:MAG: hypothetical protein A07HR60_01407 [uncultured archaeon A07HR60]|nr:MAG: hypothetical protein A07HR60_01407 [uncultured archaeon A07HR60]
MEPISLFTKVVVQGRLNLAFVSHDVVGLLGSLPTVVAGSLTAVLVFVNGSVEALTLVARWLFEWNNECSICVHH